MYFYHSLSKTCVSVHGFSLIGFSTAKMRHRGMWRVNVRHKEEGKQNGEVLVMTGHSLGGLQPGPRLTFRTLEGQTC